jgi:hypothetical protein
VTSVFVFSGLPLMPNAQAETNHCAVILSRYQALRFCSVVAGTPRCGGWQEETP